MESIPANRGRPLAPVKPGHFRQLVYRERRRYLLESDLLLVRRSKLARILRDLIDEAPAAKANATRYLQSLGIPHLLFRRRQRPVPQRLTKPQKMF